MRPRAGAEANGVNRGGGRPPPAKGGENPIVPAEPISMLPVYRLLRKIMRYPDLVETLREIFLKALAAKGIAAPEGLRQEACARLAAEGFEPTEANIREYTDLLICTAFAQAFNEQEIEDYINLARKQDRFQNLNKVVNMEGTTTRKIKKALKEFCEIPMGDLYISPSEAEGVRVALVNHFISNQLPFIGIAKHHITIRDIGELADRIIWNRRRPGKIGGKSAGMFLAYKILVPKLTQSDPEIEKLVRIPESYYINTGNFSDFIDSNELYQFHTQKYKSREELEEGCQQIAALFQNAQFSPDVVADFRELLQKVGEHPLILRSSSLLEDNFGYAFSGKYDSFFIANQGDLETRLKEFIWGLKHVHMSTYNPAPIIYRRDNNLLDFDEKMSVLVQKVVGRRFGDYFFPFAAGVAFSFGAYSWSPRIRKEDGMIRLVHGLATQAVDRVGGGYPRMVHLSHPQLRPEVEASQILKYSQKIVDVLNLKTGRLQSVPFQQLAREVTHPDLFFAVSVDQEGHLAAPMFRGQAIPPQRACLTFDNLLAKTEFCPLMRKVLRKLQEAYGRPVDVEFVWEGGLLYIVQCRSLALHKEMGVVALPQDLPPDRVLFTNDRVMYSGLAANIEYIVYVDPKAYAQLASHSEKLAIGRAVSRLNRLLQDKRFALFGPGRWGSNDITLGVRVGYGDINHTLVLGEVAFAEDGSTPEVSYGTHFFNDLVEAGILSIAIFPDQQGTVFNEPFLHRAPNRLKSLAPELAPYEGVVHVIHVPEVTAGCYLQVFQDDAGQKGVGCFQASSG